MNEQPPRRQLLYDVRDVMATCRVNRNRAFEIISASGGRVKLGRSVRVRVEDLTKYLEGLREGLPPD